MYGLDRLPRHLAARLNEVLHCFPSLFLIALRIGLHAILQFVLIQVHVHDYFGVLCVCVWKGEKAIRWRFQLACLSDDSQF